MQNMLASAHPRSQVLPALEQQVRNSWPHTLRTRKIACLCVPRIFPCWYSRNSTYGPTHRARKRCPAAAHLHSQVFRCWYTLLIYLTPGRTHCAPKGSPACAHLCSQVLPALVQQVAAASRRAAHGYRQPSVCPAHPPQAAAPPPAAQLTSEAPTAPAAAAAAVADPCCWSDGHARPHWPSVCTIE